MGELKPVNGGYYSGGHSAPVPNASTAELCREACAGVACLQATFDASIAPQMLQTPGGYFLTSNKVLPYTNASTLAECKLACLAMPHCVQITWTQPRAQERCDMYLFDTDSKFDPDQGAQGWVKHSQCNVYTRAVGGPPEQFVHSNTTQSWRREAAGGPCPSGVTHGPRYPPGCAWWLNTTARQSPSSPV